MICFHAFIAEPLTAITDHLLAISCFIFYFKLQKLRKDSEPIKSWSYFFLFTGISTFFGGLAHSFHQKEGSTYYEIWISMQMFSGLAIFFAQKGGIQSQCSIKNSKLFITLTEIQLIVYIICVLLFFNFKTVVVNSVITLGILLLLYFPNELRQWDYRTMITLGIITSFLTALVNIKKIILASWFNQHDLSHFIMFISLLLIYSGIVNKQKTKTLFIK